MQGIEICKSCSATGDKKIHFFCKTDGFIHQYEVSFLCNKCKRSEMIYRDGVYMCPSCLTKPDAFECRICKRQEVEFISAK